MAAYPDAAQHAATLTSQTASGKVCVRNMTQPQALGAKGLPQQHAPAVNGHMLPPAHGHCHVHLASCFTRGRLTHTQQPLSEQVHAVATTRMQIMRSTSHAAAETRRATHPARCSRWWAWHGCLDAGQGCRLHNWVGVRPPLCEPAWLRLIHMEAEGAVCGGWKVQNMRGAV